MPYLISHLILDFMSYYAGPIRLPGIGCHNLPPLPACFNLNAITPPVVLQDWAFNILLKCIPGQKMDTQGLQWYIAMYTGIFLEYV